MASQTHWRLAFVIEPTQILQGMLQGTEPDTLVRINQGLPIDAKFIRMHVDPFTQRLWVVLEHPSFEQMYRRQGLTSCDDTAILTAATPIQARYSGPNVHAALNEAK
jgi:hypothetical protein